VRRGEIRVRRGEIRVRRGEIRVGGVKSEWEG
jgi:hypothetical protein